MKPLHLFVLFVCFVGTLIRADDVPALTGAYSATVVSIHDGDTFRATIDLGFGVEMRDVSIRMLGVFAPELGTPGGTPATDKLRTLLPIGAHIILRPVMTAGPTPPHEIMTFQRYVARVWCGGTDVCETMNAYLKPPKPAP